MQIRPLLHLPSRFSGTDPSWDPKLAVPLSRVCGQGPSHGESGGFKMGLPVSAANTCSWVNIMLCHLNMDVESYNRGWLPVEFLCTLLFLLLAYRSGTFRLYAACKSNHPSVSRPLFTFACLGTPGAGQDRYFFWVGLWTDTLCRLHEPHSLV